MMIYRAVFKKSIYFKYQLLNTCHLETNRLVLSKVEEYQQQLVTKSAECYYQYTSLMNSPGSTNI